MITIENSGKGAVVLEKSTAVTQINIIVGGYNVKLNFPQKCEGTAINDIKRMMLGGAVKT